MGGNVPEDDAISPPGDEFIFERDQRRVAPGRTASKSAAAPRLLQLLQGAMIS